MAAGCSGIEGFGDALALTFAGVDLKEAGSVNSSFVDLYTEGLRTRERCKEVASRY